jgi:UrcA family protein
MTTNTTAQVRVSLPKITIAMLVCGIVSAAGIGAASAAVPDDGVLSLRVRYSPQSLTTEEGARSVYRKLVNAAAQVCPQDPSRPRWVSTWVQQCRQQSIARAVYKINDPKLVAVYQTSSRNG